MKLIILSLILLSSNVFAQYKVEIFKQGKLTNRGEFETMEEASSWLEKGKSEHWFARPAKTEMKCGEIDKDGKFTATESGLYTFGENCKEVEIEPAEPFEVVGPIDVSSEKQVEKAKQERKKLAKERIKNFDVSKIDNATTIKALREVVKELMVEMIEARE